MNQSQDISAPPGRPVRLVPSPPGFWTTLLGVGLAAIAPLFGFLAGSTLGATDGEGLFTPLYWGLFIGVILGGVGVVIAAVGGRRLWREFHRTSRSDEE